MIDIKIFDWWNEIKKKIQQSQKVEYFKERQIWWCSIGQNIGCESYGKGHTFTRPVLVYKKLSSGAFLGLPLTSKIKAGTWYCSFRHQGKNITALLGQARIFDKKRLVKVMGEVDDADFAKIKQGFSTLYCS